MNSLKFWRHLRGGVWLLIMEKHANGGMQRWERFDGIESARRYAEGVNEDPGTRVVGFECRVPVMSLLDFGNLLLLVKAVYGNGYISDGYHTFEELYEHRNRLFMALAALLGGGKFRYVWKTWRDVEGNTMSDWFIGGIGRNGEGQVTYHLPARLFKEFPGEVIEKSVWDGHDSKAALSRIGKLSELGSYRCLIVERRASDKL